MKFIAITNNFNNGEHVFYHLSDTAMLNQGKPFFIPDFAHPCLAGIHLAVRISRLGRSISRRFAHRYYDAVSVCCTFVAPNLLEDLQSKGLPWEMATGFDGAACIGRFQEVQDASEFKDMEFSMRINGERIQYGRTSDMNVGIDEMIARCSEYFMLRQGDCLLMGCPTEQLYEVHEDDRIEGFVNTEKLLSFNVK